MENVIELLLSDDELDLFYRNKKFFIGNERQSINIKSIEKDVLERNGVSYNQVFFEVDFSDMYKVNDIIEISIVSEKVKLINMFKIIWDGD